MSFILDALKKSESDRQRQTGPALFEVKVAPPKARFPVWAVAIAGLLVINMMIVGWLLLRRSSRGDETAAAAQNTAPAVSAPTAAPPAPNGPSTNGNTGSPSAATLPPPPTNATPSANGQSNNGASATSAPPSTQFGNAQQTSAMSDPLTQQSAPPTQQSGPPAPQSMPPAAPQPDQPPARLSDRDQNEPTLAGTPRDSGADTGASPDDYAPATDPSSSSPFKGHVRRGTESGFMLYQDLAVAAGSNLPQLRLDLHVYAAKPQDRFALINMRKLHEGDSLQGGVRVEAITPDGVVMSHNGTKFLLPRE
jgi:general secretion pathway protein B